MSAIREYRRQFEVKGEGSFTSFNVKKYTLQVCDASL